MAKFKERIIRYRGVLEKNKIFLDLILTGFVIYLAFGANKIAEQQKNLAYLEKSPSFYINVQTSYSKSDSGKVILEKELQIINLSGEYENFSENTICLLKLEYQKDFGNPTEKYIYVNGYYDANFSTGNKTGNIVSLKGYANETRLLKLEKIVREINDSISSGYLLFDFQTFTQISYLDLLGEKVFKYYNTSYGEGILMEKEKGKMLFDDYVESIKKGELIELDKINKSFILKSLGLIK
jgi:hypothetical protein